MLLGKQHFILQIALQVVQVLRGAQQQVGQLIVFKYTILVLNELLGPAVVETILRQFMLRPTHFILRVKCVPRQLLLWSVVHVRTRVALLCGMSFPQIKPALLTLAAVLLYL